MKNQQVIFLYVKRHRKTGLKYFGKTACQDPYTYLGSGKYWKRHLTAHGRDVETVEVWRFESQAECTAFALQFSISNNIVESKEWANLKPENGIDGALPGIPQSPEFKEKRLATTRGLKRGPLSDETKLKLSNSLSGLRRSAHSEKSKQQRSERMKGSNNPNYGKKLTEEAKAKINRKGCKHSEETRRRMSEARKTLYAAKRLAAEQDGSLNPPVGSSLSRPLEQ